VTGRGGVHVSGPARYKGLKEGRGKGGGRFKEDFFPPKGGNGKKVGRLAVTRN